MPNFEECDRCGKRCDETERDSLRVCTACYRLCRRREGQRKKPTHADPAMDEELRAWHKVGKALDAYRKARAAPKYPEKYAPNVRAIRAALYRAVCAVPNRRRPALCWVIRFDDMRYATPLCTESPRMHPDRCVGRSGAYRWDILARALRIARMWRRAGHPCRVVRIVWKAPTGHGPR